MDSFNAFPALNFIDFVAGIVTIFPVLKSHPFLADLSATLKVPNPTNATSSPLAKASIIVSTNTSKKPAAFLCVQFIFQLSLELTPTYSYLPPLLFRQHVLPHFQH